MAQMNKGGKTLAKEICNSNEKIFNSNRSTARPQFAEWACASALHTYSSAVLFTPLKENKTCMTNFYSTSGTALPPVSSALVMQLVSTISNMLLTSAEMRCLLF